MGGALRKIAMPPRTEKEQRLKVLLDIATRDDEVRKLQRKLKNIERRIAKRKRREERKLKMGTGTGNGKGAHHSADSSVLSINSGVLQSMTTDDAINAVDAALSLKRVYDANDG